MLLEYNKDPKHVIWRIVTVNQTRVRDFQDVCDFFSFVSVESTQYMIIVGRPSLFLQSVIRILLSVVVTDEM